ncbi:fucolectin-5-like [Tachypleus tridentatus]
MRVTSGISNTYFTKEGTLPVPRLLPIECGVKCQQDNTCYGFTFDLDNKCVLLILGDSLPSSTYYLKPMDLWKEEASINVAIGKTARHSTNYDSIRLAHWPVDNQMTCPSTAISMTSFEKFPWWYVDLGDIYIVRKIVVWNRKDTAQYRLHDFELRVGNVPPKDVGKLFDQNPLCDQHVGGGISAVPVTFSCVQPYPVGGRYVSLQIVRYCTGCPETTKNMIQLCEFQVFGYLP